MVSAIRKIRTLADGIPTEGDRVVLDTPLFIRLLEWAREEAKSDLPLHKVAENAIALHVEKKHAILGISDYNKIVTPDMQGPSS